MKVVKHELWREGHVTPPRVSQLFQYVARLLQKEAGK